LVPDHENTLLLARHRKAVAVEHIECDASHQPFDAIPWLCRSLLEVCTSRTRAVLVGHVLRHHAKVVIAAIPIDLADYRRQVVQVGLHDTKYWIAGLAVFAPTVLPALALMAKRPRG